MHRLRFNEVLLFVGVHGALLMLVLAGDEVAHYGDPDFWVLLGSASVSQGKFEPPFDPNGDHFEVDLSNPDIGSIQLNLALDIPKYDVLYPPEVTIDGSKQDFSLPDGISLNIRLDERGSAFDRAIEVVLKDPKPQTSFFSFSDGPSHTYHFRIRQAPVFADVVRATELSVVDADGKQIIADPPFDSNSDVSTYTYVVDDRIRTLQLHAVCDPGASKMAVNGAAQSGLEVQKPVLIASGPQSILVQCSYVDPLWTVGSMVQRTYVLNFQASTALDNVSMEFHMIHSEGFCEPHDSGFLCRSSTSPARFFALYDNPLVQVSMVSPYNISYDLPTGLPVRIPLTLGRREVFQIVMKAGDKERRMPLDVIWPQLCTYLAGFKCPKGLHTIPIREASARAHLCDWMECSEADTSHCCAEGNGTSVVLNEIGPNQQEVVSITQKAMGKTQQRTELMVSGFDVKASTVIEHIKNAVSNVAFESNRALLLINQHVEDATMGKTVTLMQTSLQGVLDRNFGIEGVLPKLQKQCPQMIDDLGLRSMPVKIGAELKRTVDEVSSQISKLLDETKQHLTDATTKQSVATVGKLQLMSMSSVLTEDLNKVIRTIEDLMQKMMAKIESMMPRRPVTLANTMKLEDAVALVDALTAVGATVRIGINSNPMCNTFVCPDSLMLVVDAATKECEDAIGCTEADTATCCARRVLCASTVCPLGYAHKVAEYGVELWAPEGGEAATCCFKVAMCNDYECPSGYLPITSAMTTNCAAEVCRPDQCCSVIPKCEVNGFRFKCPKGFVLKNNASFISDAGGLSVQECCEVAASCSSLSCPIGSALVAKATKTFCAGSVCTLDADLKTCCSAAGSCLSFDCPPPSILRSDPQQLYCRSSSCDVSNTDICCARPASCASMTCPSPFVLDMNATSTLCRHISCTLSDASLCCGPPAWCEGFACPKLPVPYGLRPSADFIACQSTQCSTADVDQCCEQKRLCSELPCKGGLAPRIDFASEYRNTWDANDCCAPRAACYTYLCPIGFVLKSDDPNLLCSSETCSDVDAGICCQPTELSRKVPINNGTLQIVVEPSGPEEGSCHPYKSGFWCDAFKSEMRLEIVRYHGDTISGKQSLQPVSLPPRNSSAAVYLSLFIQDPSIVDAMLSLWVARAPNMMIMA